MKRIQLGRVVSGFGKEKIIECVKHIKEKFKGVKIEYYNSELPFARTLGKPGRSRKASVKKFNHVVVKKGKNKIVEMFGTKWKASGFVYDENLTKKEQANLIALLAGYHIFTFKSLKQYAPGIKYGMLTFAFFLLFLSSTLTFFTEEAWVKAFGLLVSLYAVVLLVLYAR